MAGPFNWISQVASVSAFNVRTVHKRLGSSLTAVLGIAGVVAVMVAVLSIAQGILRAMESSSAPENVIVLRSGATAEGDCLRRTVCHYRCEETVHRDRRQRTAARSDARGADRAPGIQHR